MLRRFGQVGRGRGAILGIALSLAALPASGQELPAYGAGQQPPVTVTEMPLSFQIPGLPLGAYPLELLGLLGPPAERGPVTLRPSIALSEEYNDNVLLNNRNRQWDLITGFSPALALTVNRPSYQLSGGYTLTGEVYERESRFNDAYRNQAFVASALYRGERGVTLSVFEAFILNRNTSLTTSQAFASGRQEVWSNTLSPAMTWQMTPRTSLSLAATYSVQRFPGAAGGPAAGLGSDSYRLQVGLSQVITPRLSGILGYGFTYLDFLGQQQTSTTHTPTLGVTYRLTPTLVGALSGGPSITELEGTTSVSPALTASLVQTLRIGSISVQYARAVAVAGGFGGTTDTQTFAAGASFPTWKRGLVLVLGSAYSIAKSVSARQTTTVDVTSFTVPVEITYQLARYTSVFAGYTFLKQRTGSSSSVQLDVDQDRVRVGVQFGYPINFD